MRQASRRLRKLLAMAALLYAGDLVAAGARAVPDSPPVDPEEIARRVARNQRLLEKRWSGATYDFLDVRTTYDKEGHPKEIHRRLYYVLAGEGGRGESRDLVEVDGRPPTAEEIQEAAEDDAKRRRRIDERAARRASSRPNISGDDEDPLFDDRRLSEILGRYELRFIDEEIVDGRPVYVLEFVPRPGFPARSVAERAFASMAGLAVVDASDLQILSLEAHLTKNLKIGGGLAANVKEARMVYRAVRLGPGVWFPCRVDLDVSGKAVLFFRIASGFRFDFGTPKSFHVEEEAVVGQPAGLPPEPR
ncbi:MAG: hypothetical protein ACHQPI_12000 [Thermoanaerobaculia bacterium]